MIAHNRPNVWIVAGPTASGKSALALRLAQAYNGCIINADSMQIYVHMAVISAQPSEADMAVVPHKLYGHVALNQPYSAGHWAHDAVAQIKAALSQGQQPILVGGTGFWLQALVHGMSPIPSVPSVVRARVNDLYDLLGPQAFHAALDQIDSDAAARLNPADKQRMVRAREVWEATGQTLSHWQAAPKQSLAPPEWQFKLVALVPPRDWLYARIDTRFEAMLNMGALAEAKAIHAQILQGTLAPDLPSLKAVGLAPLLAYLDGQLNLQQAVQMAQTQTRQYAKRQYTWLKHQTLELPHRLTVKTILSPDDDSVEGWLITKP